MRRLTIAIIITLLALAASSFDGHAARRACDCPAVKISCMDVTTCGELLTFITKISDTAAGAKLSYNWTVSVGKIVTGQGTSSIKVDTAGLDGDMVEATVRI